MAGTSAALSVDYTRILMHCPSTVLSSLLTWYSHAPYWQFTDVARDLAATFNHVLFNYSANTYTSTSCAQAANALPLLSGIADNDDNATAGASSAVVDAFVNGEVDPADPTGPRVGAMHLRYVWLRVFVCLFVSVIVACVYWIVNSESSEWIVDSGMCSV